MELTRLPDGGPPSTAPDKQALRTFAAALAPLTAVCRPGLTNAQVHGYYHALGDLARDVLFAAASKLAATRASPYYPMPGEIRASALEITAGEQMGAYEAFGVAMKAARRFGQHGRERAKADLPAAVLQTIDAIGWQSMCDARPSDLDTIRAQFRDAYQAVAGRAQRRALLPPALARAIEAIGRERDIKALANPVKGLAMSAPTSNEGEQTELAGDA